MDPALGVCYLHSMETLMEQARLVCEGVIVIMAIYFILKVSVWLHILPTQG